MNFKLFFLIPTLTMLLAIVTVGCETTTPQDPAYLAELDQWHQQRVERLKRPTGWLSLAGLFWLSQGENTLGSAESNQMVFPQMAPRKIGAIYLEDQGLRFVAEGGVTVLSDSVVVGNIPLISDADGRPTVLESGSLSWYIIKRGERYGVRLRDSENPLLQSFSGIERYPINKAWQVKARFEPYHPPKTVLVPTILGTEIAEECLGALVFEINGKTFRLDPLGKMDDEEWFVIFGDKTNGVETYGGGRFLYVACPDDSGRTLLDFNKAYNPPCVFNEYATCPLPPAENRLEIDIGAGEKNYAVGVH